VTASLIVVHRSADLLAAAVGARLVTRLVDMQAAGQVPSWVLTGGTIADNIHRTLAVSPARDAVDWEQVEIWWGDERFLPAGSSERNETQARAALLDALSLDSARVHAMPPSDAGDGDPDTAASSYADELAAAARPEDHGASPTFDIVMLGVGPDGHVASLFPEMPALYDERPVVAVRGAPKPPPVRLTFTLGTLNRAREVWFVASGKEKAAAVQMAMSGAGPVQVPAAGPRGLQRTLWLLDTEAASELPPTLPRLASP
jgi:6-phosphogluconolactonase